MKSTTYLFICIFLLLCTLQSCTAKKEKIIDTSQLVIPDSIYSFFPDRDSLSLKLYSMGTNASKKSRIGESSTFLEAYFYKIYSCEHETQFEFLMHKYRQEAIDSLKPIDDRYFIVKYESEMFKMYDYKTLKEKYRESVNKYILPSFHNDMREIYGVNYNFTTVCGLPEDYEILIMKSGRNYILPENDTWKFDWKLLPPELKHGYTSGVAYRNASDKIIYWSIAW